MWESLAGMLNSPGFNSIVLLGGVFVALRQLRAAQDGVRQQLETVRQQIAASQTSHVESLADSRQIAKRRETARLLLESRGDQMLQRGYRAVDRYYTSKLNIRILADATAHPDRLSGEEDEPFEARCASMLGDRNDVMYVLNHFENVAICVDREIYCRDMIVDAWRTLMIECFRHSRPLIDAIREKQKNPKALEKFQIFVESLERPTP